MQWSSSRFRFVLVLPLFVVLGMPVLAAHAGSSALDAVPMSASCPLCGSQAIRIASGHAAGFYSERLP